MDSARRLAALCAACVALGIACSDDDAPRPLPPGRLSAIVTGTILTRYDFVLHWEPVGVRDAYRVEVRGDDGPWNTVGTVGWNATGATVTFAPDLPDATLLTFRVASLYEGRASAWAETTIAYPVRPAMRLEVAARAGGFDLSWVPRALVADAIRVERRLVAHGGLVTVLAPVELPASATSLSDEALQGWLDGARIRYDVVYVRRGVESEPAEAQSPPAPPIAPADVVATADGRTVRLTWTNRSASATRIEIRTRRFPGDAPDPLERPRFTLAPTAAAFEETHDEYGIWSYSVAAVSAAGRSDATVHALTAPPELLAAFDAHVVELPDASGAAGAPDAGWVLTRGTVGLVPVAGTWEPRTFEQPRDVAAAMSGEVGVLAGVDGSGVAISTRGTGEWTRSWIAESWNVSQVAAAAAGEDAAVAWRAYAPDPSGQTVFALRYADRRGGWTAEAVTCGAPTYTAPSSLRLDEGGEPMMIDDTYRQLVRRSAGVWTCEPIEPTDLADPFSQATLLGFAPTAGGGALVVTHMFGGLYAFERDGSGWLSPVRIAERPYGFEPVSVTVGAGGRALVLEEYWKSLHVRGGDGAWTTLPLPRFGAAIAGFDASGKAWVLDGLVDGYQRSYADRRPYALFVER